MRPTTPSDLLAIPNEPPPPSRSVRAFEPKPRGRPPVWASLLRKAMAGKKAKQGPYKNEPTATAAASYLNKQMREKAPREFEKGFRFRGRRVYVIVKRLEV